MTLHYVNLYEIINLPDFECECQYLKVTGLPPDSSYNKNLNLLVKRLAYELKKPVALINKEGEPHIAIPIDSPLPRSEQSLTPHVATLTPLNETTKVKLGSLNQETFPIGLSFLRYAFKGVLMRDQSLWSFGNSLFFSKIPVFYQNTAQGRIDVYGGFKYRIMALESNRLFLCVDLAYKYIEHDWLTSHLTEQSIDDFRMRHFLYCFGNQFYDVQLIGDTGLSIKDQKFQPDPSSPHHDIFTYTKERWRGSNVDFINLLDPDSPAIVYKYPGSEKEAYGAAALCKLILPTDDPRVRFLHSRSIKTPTDRFREIEKIIKRHLLNAKLAGKRVVVNTDSYVDSKRCFAVPDQLVGHGQVIHVRRNGDEIGIPLSALGRTRMAHLVDRNTGPLSTSRFDAQYVFLPLSLERQVAEDFLARFSRRIDEIYPCQYEATPVYYDDKNAKTLMKQVQAIQNVIAENEIDHGYALLILPSRAESDLHNHIKKELWPDIQCQCASADSIQSFYKKSGESWSVNDQLGRRYSSYLLHLALGVLIVNRKWISALNDPLNYDVHIGIDVLNHMAGFTYVYLGGSKTYFRSSRTQQNEKLSTKHLRTMLRGDLERDIQILGIAPMAIVIHRDGNSYPSETKGLSEAIRNLKADGVIGQDIIVGVVEIHKHSAYPLRIVEGSNLDSLRNPLVGSWFRLNDKEGIVCNTGAPFLTQGTAKPLHVKIADGRLEIEKVLEDVFALSNLTWSAPDKCQRLPITIKIGDTFLRPIASPADMERVLYGEEEEGEGGIEETVSDEDELETVEQAVAAE